MSLDRFNDMLVRKSLFFCRADSFEDKFEGMWGTVSRKQLESELRNHIENGGTTYGGLNYQLSAHKRTADAIRGLTAVNCWHQNSHESDAMWKLYVGLDPGIAIRSTISNLIASIPDDKNLLVHVGMVKYIDYGTDPIPTGNYMTPYMYKRKHYDFEQEIRAVAVKARIEESEDSGSIALTNEEFTRPGEHVAIDLAKLIDSVHLAPQSSELTERRVLEAINDRGLIAKVIRSRLDDEPA